MTRGKLSQFQASTDEKLYLRHIYISRYPSGYESSGAALSFFVKKKNRLLGVRLRVIII